MSTETMPKGTFFESLKSNNSKIREDRAASISEDAQLAYKRQVEDIVHEIKKTSRERENMLDLSGTTTTNIISASDFEATEFIAKDLELGIKLRNLKIKLEVASERYKELFGEDAV